MHEKVVFTNGCFDIIHAGHVRYLQAARELGDKLIVGLNSDTSFEEHKGRPPINPQYDRLEVLHALGCVDDVILFEEPTPLKLIGRLQPYFLVKGNDYKPQDVIGKEYANVVICLDVGCDTHTEDILARITLR